ncbi:MAG TPA: M55 family metallopeptidase, partial [Ramlibacter sp.]
VRFNGGEVGEAAMYGALAGEYGVPVAMASGDDVFIAEHKPLFPDTVFVQTKRATGQTSGISLSPQAAREAIRTGVATALRRERPKPYVLKVPVTVRIQAQSTALADLFCQWPTLERVASDEVGFEAPTVEAAVRIVNCLSAMSTMLR